jgi:hypothetical protein
MRMRIVLAVCVGMMLALGSTATATAKETRGSSAAKVCQKGGWLKLQRPDGTQFADQSSCVSFGAQGGTLSAIPPRHINVTLVGPFPYCTFSADVEHFRANTTYSGSADWIDGATIYQQFAFTVTTDDVGSGTATIGTWVSGGSHSSVVAKIDGTTGSVAPAWC